MYSDDSVLSNRNSCKKQAKLTEKVTLWKHLKQSAVTFVEIDHEIFSMVILSLPLIQERQLSVSSEKMCTNTG